MPTEALRRGDLSASANPIYDPATGTANGTGRTAFPGNIIPQNRIDPTAQKIISLMPMPNLPGETNNYFVAAPFEFNRWTLDTKVNWNATSKLNIFGRYSHLDFWTFNETVYGDVCRASRSPAAIRARAGLHGELLGGRHLRRSRRTSWPTRTSATCGCTPTSRIPTSARTRAWTVRDSRAERPARVRGRHAGLQFNTFQGIGITELYMPYTATTISIRRS